MILCVHLLMCRKQELHGCVAAQHVLLNDLQNLFPIKETKKEQISFFIVNKIQPNG